MDDPRTPTQAQTFIPILNTTPEQAVASLSVFDGKRWDRWIIDFEAATMQFVKLSSNRKALLLWSRLSPNVHEKGESSKYNPTSSKSDYKKFVEFLEGCYPVNIRPKDQLWEFKDTTDRFLNGKSTFEEFVLEFKMHYKEHVEEHHLTKGEDDLIKTYFLSGISNDIRNQIGAKLMGIKHPTAKEVITAGESIAVVPDFMITSQQRKLQRHDFEPQVHPINNYQGRNNNLHQNTFNKIRRNDELYCPYCRKKGHKKDNCNMLQDHLKKQLVIMDHSKRICWANSGRPVNFNQDINKSPADIVGGSFYISNERSKPQAQVKLTKLSDEELEHELITKREVGNFIKVMSNQPVNSFIPTTTVQMRNDAMKEAYGKFKEATIPIEIKYLLSNPDIVRYIMEENKMLKAKYEQHTNVQGMQVALGNIKSLSPSYIQVKIQEKYFPALVDSGSQVNIISKEVSKKLNLPVNNSYNASYQGINGDKENFEGGINQVKIKVGTICRTLFFYVSNKISEELILGKPFIHEFGVITKAKPDGDKLWVSDEDKKVEVQIYSGIEEIQSSSVDVMKIKISNEKLNLQDLVKGEMDNEGFELRIEEKLKMAAKIKSKKINTVRKRVAEKIKPQNVGLPIEARLESGNKIERPILIDRLTEENIKKIQFSSFLLDQEKLIFLQRLHEVQGALGFSINDLGILAEGIEKPIKIHTVPHQPWQLKPLKFSQI
ncbi:hypothetical protein HMI56_003695, partial [Coelomomyces lativittatus]